MKKKENSIPEAVLVLLHECVSAHWTAIEFYTAAAAHFKRWKYKKLAHLFKGEAHDERKHMKWLMERLEWADESIRFKHAAPNFERHDAKAALTIALDLETSVCKIENDGAYMARSTENRDEVSARLFGHLVVPTEDTIELLTAHLRQIDEIGIQNYLQDMR